MLDSLAGNGTHKLSSPEAALLLAENYAKINFKPKDIEAENILGAVLWRDEEDPTFISPYKSVIFEYTSYDIKKYFGYTLKEYLELNLYEVGILKSCATKLREDFIKQTEQMKTEMKTNSDAMKDTLSGLENLEEEIM